jgi:hypothetical protein
MTDFSPAELIKRTHTHLNQYITSADQKMSILLTAHLAFIGLYGGRVSEVWMGSSIDFKTAVTATLISGTVAASLAAWVIYPRNSQAEEDGLMFWGSIVEYEQSEFVSEFGDLDDEAALDELIQQNHSLARVADSKYEYTRCALIATAVTVGFAAASAGLFFF